MLQAQQLTQYHKETQSSMLSASDEPFLFGCCFTPYTFEPVQQFLPMHMQAPAKFISNFATCPII